MDSKAPPCSRQIAFQAFLKFLRDGIFLSENPLDPFSKNLSYGACQWLIALEKFIKPVRPKKVKERALLILAVYEHFFMKSAAHAKVYEWVELAKNQIHPSFAKFINHYLRNLPGTFPFSDKDTYPELFLRSVPEYVLRLFNQPAPLWVRDRKDKLFIEVQDLQPFLKGDRYYVQNPTPFYLIEEALEHIPQPKTVLDLCANPGGKSIALHEIYPDAELHLNDIKELTQIRENLERLNIQAKSLTQGDAREYPESQFDLVLLDAPCSNTGVLHKRPEARHRLDKKHLQEMKELQQSLLKSALKHVKRGGHLFFITCSILAEENEISDRFKWKKLILPTNEGLDGGFLGIISN